MKRNTNERGNAGKWQNNSAAATAVRHVESRDNLVPSSPGIKSFEQLDCLLFLPVTYRLYKKPTVEPQETETIGFQNAIGKACNTVTLVP